MVQPKCFSTRLRPTIFGDSLANVSTSDKICKLSLNNCPLSSTSIVWLLFNSLPSESELCSSWVPESSCSISLLHHSEGRGRGRSGYRRMVEMGLRSAVLIPMRVGMDGRGRLWGHSHLRVFPAAKLVVKVYGGLQKRPTFHKAQVQKRNNIIYSSESIVIIV